MKAYLTGLRKPSSYIFVALLLGSYFIGQNIPPTWVISEIGRDIEFDKKGAFYNRENKQRVDRVKPARESTLTPQSIAQAIARAKAADKKAPDPGSFREFIYFEYVLREAKLSKSLRKSYSITETRLEVEEKLPKKKRKQKTKAQKIYRVRTITAKDGVLELGAPKTIDRIISESAAILTSTNLKKLNAAGKAPPIFKEYVKLEKKQYYERLGKRHWGFWSLLPALVAISLCWITKEPITALLGGVVSGGFIFGSLDILNEVLLPSLMTSNAAGILILYLWLLGALMGIWSVTGAARAFAEYITVQFVRGPKSAKLVAWCLGVLFFQGGTVSTVLVGTTVKPIADKENISHEELSFIVDSTASPIASLLAFNAWPGYVQAFMLVSGVAFLATEQARLTFFFASVPFSFYAIFAVFSTFLLSIEKLPYYGKKMKAAMERARNEGLLDRPGSEPLSAKELESTHVPEGYKPHMSDFLAPLILLIFIALFTFGIYGSPKVRWAFGAAVLLAAIMALLRGMTLHALIHGVGEGLKGIVLGSVVLLLAITIGSVSKETGGGTYLVELLGTQLPYWSLPVVLQLLTIIIAFSTGTSWGTYAVALPLAMPLAWAVAASQGLQNPEFFLMICFAAVLNGSVFGDQCSPISDTTILSSMCTGCDLMDHVKTQMPLAIIAAVLAGICWTGCVIFFA